MKARSAADIKEIDRRCVADYRIPSLLLMEHAGKGAAALAREMNPARRMTVIIAGKGNNGGDGLVVARWLKFASIPVKVWLVDGASGYGKNSAPWYNLQIVKYMGIPLAHFMGEAQSAELKKDIRNAGLVVDAMLGTGLSGDVREPYAGIISAINELAGEVLAIDVPSGLNADTGEPLGVAVKASKTATFAAPKLGFETEQGREYCGEIVVVDIGVPPELM